MAKNAEVLQRLPLLFTYTDVVSGNGFRSRVTACGRVLAEEEAEGWWFYGVQPGGLAASGDTALEAHSKFREDFRLILFDLAEESTSFEDFKNRVERFFNEVTEDTLAEWKETVQAVRDGKVVVGKEAATLPKIDAYSARYVEVSQLADLASVTDNVTDQALAAAA